MNLEEIKASYVKPLDEIHLIKTYAKRGKKNGQAFVDMAMIDETELGIKDRLFAVSFVGKYKEVKEIQHDLLDARAGMISSTDTFQKNEANFGFSNPFLTGEAFYTESTRQDDLFHYLMINQQINSNAQIRSDLEETIRKIEEERYTGKLNDTNSDKSALDETEAEFLIAWDGNIIDHVYNILWDRYATPIMEEWKQFLFDELIQLGYLRVLTTYTFGQGEDTQAPIGAVLKLMERDLEEIISNGVLSMDLPFALEVDDSVEDVLTDVDGLMDYLTNFGGPLAENIQEFVQYGFNPEKDTHHNAFRDVNMAANQSGLTGLFPAQANAVMSCAETLQKHNHSFLIGEMG